jgi:hypothetical protein
MTFVPRLYFAGAHDHACVPGQDEIRATGSQIEQARHLIERKRQLAYHDDKRNREEVKAVIHRRVTQKFEEGLRGSKTCYCNDDSPT